MTNTIKNIDIQLRDNASNKLYPLAHKDSGGNVIVDTYLRTNDNRAHVFYGTCSTAASTAAKFVDCSNFTDLSTGAVILVKFSNTNSAAVDSITLNVNSSGAKPIKCIINGSINNLPSASYLLANQTYLFSYDGTNWVTVADYNTDSSVTQTLVTANSDYPLLLAPSGQTATITTTANFATGATFNPNTGTLTATTFSGALSGNATTATNATNATYPMVTAETLASRTRYLALVNGHSTENKSLYTSSILYTQYDTTWMLLALGVANSNKGWARFFDNSHSYYGQIATGTTFTGNHNYYLPDATGTLALTSSDITGNAATATSATSATRATQDGSGNTISSYYCTLSTAQTISGTKTFTARPLIDISGTALAANAVANILSFKYKNPNNQLKTVDVIRTYGDSEASTAYNGIAIIGSSSGTTVISAGENAATVIANEAISNTENAYIITDGSINF